MTDISQALRKRRRPAIACVECRRRKVKCDLSSPCRRCVQKSATCTYAEYNRTTRNIQASRRSRVAAATETERQAAEVLRQPPDRPIRNDSIQQRAANGIVSAAEDGLPLGAPVHSAPSEFGLDRFSVGPGEQCQRPHIQGNNTSRGSPHSATISGPICGTLSKTRVFGHGHWMSAYPLAGNLQAFDLISHMGVVPSQETNTGSNHEIHEAVMKCKQLAREVKTQRPSRRSLPAGIRQSFPSSSVMEKLVRLYFGTFESCFRILHSPSFYMEYDSYVSDAEAAKTPFVVKLLLVMSIVAPIQDDATSQQDLRTKARGWIHIAQTWLSGPLEKDRLTIDGLQIYCLLLLARQVNYIGADLVWISAGSLVRMAMQMGLHQDPDHLGEMSTLQKEVRRRLWFTILEMNVQAALDSGMSPIISADDYDTQLPSNLNDDDFCDPSDRGAEAKQETVPTETSFQRLLGSSLHLRLEVTRVINNLQKGPSYDQVLRLGAELMSACHSATIAIDHYRSVGCHWWFSEFPQNLCDHYHRRFLLCLHLPFAVKAFQNPIYSYSAKLCLEASLAVISLLEDETYHRLLVVGGGMFRDILTHSAMIIFLELTTQLEGDNAIFSKSRNKARREPLLEDARKVVQYAQERVVHGETNIKGYVYLRMAMSQVEAMLDGSPITDAVSKAASESLAMCYDILKSTAEKLDSTTTTQPDLTCWPYGATTPISSVADINFDFLTGSCMDFDQPGSFFVQQWQDQTEF